MRGCCGVPPNIHQCRVVWLLKGCGGVVSILYIWRSMMEGGFRVRIFKVASPHGQCPKLDDLGLDCLFLLGYEGVRTARP